jgi:hypothetical protein
VRVSLGELLLADLQGLIDIGDDIVGMLDAD